MSLTFEKLVDAAKINLDLAEVLEIKHSTDYSQIAIGQALIAIALELKKFNDEADLERVREDHRKDHGS